MADLDMTSIDAILAEREKTHGKFEDHATYTQNLKYILAASEKYFFLTSEQKEALEMICHKIGRILAGNPNEPDHWTDIAGYATLIVNAIKREKGTFKGREINETDCGSKDPNNSTPNTYPSGLIAQSLQRRNTFPTT